MDRIKKYLMPLMEKYIFDELSDSYLKKAGLQDILSGIPVPLRAEEIKKFQTQNGIALSEIGENMIWVVGIDPDFPHAAAYRKTLKKLLSDDAAEAIAKEAQTAADKGLFEEACIHFRAALFLKPNDLLSLYGYAGICYAMYNKSNEADYIGSFKAESLEQFETLTEMYPKFAQGWYYLGYMYLNLGLYTKAGIAWKYFLETSKDVKERKEIENRISQIEVPIEIEKACNAVLTGRYELGIRMLESFTGGSYDSWWPLWYYLGEGYTAAGRRDDAIAAFTKVLRLNASHIETMNTLIELYASEGNDDMVKKYEVKIVKIKEQLEM